MGEVGRRRKKKGGEGEERGERRKRIDKKHTHKKNMFADA